MTLKLTLTGTKLGPELCLHIHPDLELGLKIPLTLTLIQTLFLTIILTLYTHLELYSNPHYVPDTVFDPDPHSQFDPYFS